jgi:predicted metal-dependent phosphoesterase TrpH
MTIDFHVHSTASDGTLTPQALAEKAQGFAAIALTDHDNLDGVAAFRAAAQRLGVPAVTGVELSIEPGEGFDKFHLLAIGVDPAHPALAALLRRILEGRKARNERILARFAACGIEIAPAELSRYAKGEILARPHFAQCLVARGHAADVKSAFERYLLPDSPAATRCYEERWHPAQEETFRTVHAAGGICVMAHPKYWRSSWRTEGVDFAAVERGLAALREKGLDGVEALYQANTPAENVEFIRLAKRQGYLLSAGSDFHGANKPQITLGMAVSQAYAAPLLERLGV